MFSQFKICIAAPLSSTSIFSCYMTMISYFFIINQFFTYQVLLDRKFSFSFSVIIRFLLKYFFNYFFRAFVIFKNCLNKSISSILISIKKIGLLNLNKIVRKTARNVILMFFCVKALFLLTLFKIHSKST